MKEILLLLSVAGCAVAQPISSPFTPPRHIYDHSVTTMPVIYVNQLKGLGIMSGYAPWLVGDNEVAIISPNVAEVKAGLGRLRIYPNLASLNVDLNMNLKGIVNVSTITFADGTIMTSTSGFGGGGGGGGMQNPSTATLNMNNFKIINVSTIAFSGGQVVFSTKSLGGLDYLEIFSPVTSFRRRSDGSLYLDIADTGITCHSKLYLSQSDTQFYGSNVLQTGTQSVAWTCPAGTVYRWATGGNNRFIIDGSAGVTYSHDFRPLTHLTYNIGDETNRWTRVWCRDVEGAYVTSRSTGTRIYGLLNTTMTALSDATGRPVFWVHHSTFESTANRAIVITSAAVFGAGEIRGIAIDAGADSPDYRGNIIVGNLSANNWMRPTQGRLNVKGGFYVTSGYSNEYISMNNSSSGNYLDFGSAGGRIQYDGSTVINVNGVGNVTIPSLTGTASYSLLRYNTSDGRLYYDTSVRANKTNIENWIETVDVSSLTVKTFVDKTSGRKEIGLVAEDLEAAGLKELCVYDSSGTLVGVAYEKIALVLIPIVAEQQARIERLELAVVALSSGTFSEAFPEGFPAGKPVTSGGENATHILYVLAALVSGVAGAALAALLGVGRKNE